GTFHWILAFATGGLSTADVYAACDRIRARNSRRGKAGEPAPASVSEPVLDKALMAALRSGDPAALGPLLSNDLQSTPLSRRRPLRARGTCGGRWRPPVTSPRSVLLPQAPARPAPFSPGPAATRGI